MFPLPPPRRMSVATAISDRDGGEDLTVERHEIRGPHSTSSRKSRREVAQAVGYLTLCMLGNLSSAKLSSAEFLKLAFSSMFFKEYYQNSKQF
ncbi:hypothetical protein DPMN_063427 [Dreissena polymorpha]|uniref:Uncharacterized protein n=1 Tax=Dreissena polymorpha TaxID=45954 RepID=A0A9D4HK82_DREPO|nr:hypothetical protein DPMN_063427 [Dreissena polymorpha]